MPKRVMWLLESTVARIPTTTPTAIADAMLPSKEERIHRHRHRARAHRERRPRRLEQDPQRRIQHAGSERDRDQVVDRGPEEILFDLAVHTTGKNEGGGDVGWVVLHENDSGRLDRNVGSRADRDPDGRRRQRRRVVYPIPNHRHAAALLLESL